ncbi:MAG: hypothetical protein AMXMBFR13_26590 [Phycisphaerae bacterium]
MNDQRRPHYSKWRRRKGGRKVCPACKHAHPAASRVNGRTVRPKVCAKCGAKLPALLTYSKKSEVAWYVREFDPETGSTRDIACDSSEAADELIRRKVRDWTPDPVKQSLLERASVLIRSLDAGNPDDAVNQLIVALGGDPAKRALKPIGWQEAVDIIAAEMGQKGSAAAYVEDLRRVARDLQAITGLTDWTQVDLEAVSKYRAARLAGRWRSNGRPAPPIGGHSLNKHLNTLSAFFTRAVRKGWVVANPLKGATDERVKVPQPRVEYMPDADLRALVDAADTVWLRALVIVAYYTGARRNDLLALAWDRDIDLDGSKVAGEGRSGPHIYVRGSKADTPHWMPLHPAAVQALKALRQEPVIAPEVFPLKSTSPGPRASRLFADLCIKAGLTMTVERGGKQIVVNRWSLHDLRRKANTDLRNGGASPKERATLLGHRGTAVNESHYEATIPSRERELIDGLPSFGLTG